MIFVYIQINKKNQSHKFGRSNMKAMIIAKYLLTSIKITNKKKQIIIAIETPTAIFVIIFDLFILTLSISQFTPEKPGKQEHSGTVWFKEGEQMPCLEHVVFSQTFFFISQCLLISFNLKL